MARGIPIPYEQLPRTATNLGGFQKSAGIEGLNTNNSASIQAAGNVAQVDPRGFVVAEQQVGNIGKAIAGEGQAIMAIRLKQNEAINIRKEYEANTSMELAQAKINSDLELEPDETKWAGIAEKHSTALRDSLLKQDLSPDARDAISLKVDSWQRRASLAVTLNSAKRSNDKVVDAAMAEVTQLVTSKNYVLARTKLKTMVDSGYVSKQEAARQEARMAELVQKQKVEQTLEFADKNYEVFKIDPDKYLDGLDYEDQLFVKSKADQLNRNRVVESADVFSDRVARGDFKTLKDLETGFPTNMRDTTRLEFTNMWKRMNNAEIQAKLIEDAPMNFSRYKDYVKSYNRTEDPDGKRFVQLKLAIDQAIPEGLRVYLLNPLKAKYSGTGGPQIADAVRDTVDNITRSMFDAGGFGQYKSLQQRSGFAPIEVVDEKEKIKAYIERGKAEMHMDQWMAQTPNATITEATIELNNFRAGKAATIRSTVQPMAPPQEVPEDEAEPTATPETLSEWELGLPSVRQPRDKAGLTPGAVNVEQANLLFGFPPSTDLSYDPSKNGNNP
jgi:ribosomal protein S20